MRRFKLNMKAMIQRSVDKAATIEVGSLYFLSSFYDQDGATVKVLSTPAKGSSSVEVVIVEPLGREAERPHGFYEVGKIHSVNACNLYKDRIDASHTTKFGPTPEVGARRLMSALTGLSTEKIEAICERPKV